VVEKKNVVKSPKSKLSTSENDLNPDDDILMTKAEKEKNEQENEIKKKEKEAEVGLVFFFSLFSHLDFS
jgi:hypothetical protein